MKQNIRFTDSLKTLCCFRVSTVDIRVGHHVLDSLCDKPRTDLVKPRKDSDHSIAGQFFLEDFEVQEDFWYAICLGLQPPTGLEILILLIWSQHRCYHTNFMAWHLCLYLWSKRNPAKKSSCKHGKCQPSRTKFFYLYNRVICSLTSPKSKDILATSLPSTLSQSIECMQKISCETCHWMSDTTGCCPVSYKYWVWDACFIRLSPFLFLDWTFTGPMSSSQHVASSKPLRSTPSSRIGLFVHLVLSPRVAKTDQLWHDAGTKD